MNSRPGIIAILFFCAVAQAQDIGLTTLRAVTTNLAGSGVTVAQPEADYNLGTNWEVNPGAVGQPSSLFTYISAAGSTTNFPNSISSESAHADGVGQICYGVPNGVATNVAHVDNFDADFFYMNYVANASLPAIGDPIVNQSFTFGNVTNASQTNGAGSMPVSEQQELDSEYDDYAAQNKTLFISAVNNQDSVSPPGTSYNGIGVAAYGGASSIGPTLDNGRCKPDITAPAEETSGAAPVVSGAAAVLMQAALRGDGGSDTNSAFNLRTIKALLLNGAVKPANWTNSTASPLDARYGAGVVNIFNACEQLAGGKHGYIVSTTVAIGDAHPPTGASGSIAVLSGWDFNTNTSSSVDDAINHYYFNVTNSLPGGMFTATATLVWNRQQNQSDINNLNLFLYNCASSNLVMCSTSLVDNVEHIHVPQLAQGRYDLQVWKAGGVSIVDTNFVSAAEPYALAWGFFSDTLNASRVGANAALAWPLYPAGFLVEAQTNLLAGAWSTNNLPGSIITNGQNYLLLNATNATQFFRLRYPNL